jgi:predicted aconitase with swiveling domain
MFAGRGTGPLLRLGAPLSFWGGVDPKTGTIIAEHHPDRGREIAGTVLVIGQPIGSSSSSSVLLELIHASRAPAAVLLGRADAILVIGCLVAREMRLAAPPMVEIDIGAFDRLELSPGAEVAVEPDGTVGHALR